MKYESFEQMLAGMDSGFGGRPALVWSDEKGSSSGNNRKGGRPSAAIKSLTYHDLRIRIRELSVRMKEDRSECVGICGIPSADWVINMFAAVCAGKRTVLVDPMINDDELKDVIILTGMDNILTDSPVIKRRYEKIIKGIAAESAGTSLCQAKGKNAAPAASAADAGDVSAETVMPADDGGDGEAIDCGGRLLFFTSGTTAKRRAVVLSQRALLSSAWNGQQMMKCRPEDTVLCLLPLNHVFGFVCSLLWPLTNGAAVAFGRGMRHFSDDPAFFHTTILPVVPTLLVYLLKTDALNRELSGLLVGAGPCDMESLKEVWMRGIDLRFGYGLTETASGLAISLKGQNPFSMALCPDTEITIGDDGQVFARTTCMMDGYYHDPEHTREKLTDRGLATGDVGRIDARGHLHILGRMDDVLVRSNGEKIFLREWEEELSGLTGTETVLIESSHRLTLAVKINNGEGENVPSAGTKASGAEAAGLSAGFGEEGISPELEAWQTEILRKIDEYNRKQPVGRKIDDVKFWSGEFPRTQTGKLQRWKIENRLSIE